MIELAGNLIIRDGKLLLLYRGDESHWESQRSQGESCSNTNQDGWWELPGGKVEEDESPTEAAVREAEEEIGVEVELEKPFYSGEFLHDEETFLWHGYIASMDDEPALQEGKFEEMEWFKPPELDELSEDGELAPNLVQILPALRRLG